MALRRVGGKSDGGIDLQGWWWVPQLWKPLDPLAVDELSQRRRIRVLAQCKAERKKFSPNYVREMEGVLYRHMATTPTTHASQPSLNDTHLFSYPSIALLVSESAFTKSTLLRAFSSTVPFFLLHLPQQASNDIQHKGDSVALGSAFWNPALSGESGILGGEMEIRWERSLSGGGRPAWQGQGRTN
ncbi:hypothetical protein SERLA73DRAFT_149816 [Serpula lacrymans var. lacrymans S7.3]|uniref:Uncharacterized protein n=1 Tax=Serpula lacrymans var. lacrymans (strain S7.3) TaxID=936435 RepID=F8PK93_SERL3|nr:hypothetical protein SERLA73DRAFT_149816 [Serpula lacrymans var. lacrymans S7.3]